MTSLENTVLQKLDGLSLEFVNVLMQLKTGQIINPDQVQQVCKKYGTSFLYLLRSIPLEEIESFFEKETIFKELDKNGALVLELFEKSPQFMILLFNRPYAFKLTIWNKEFGLKLMALSNYSNLPSLKLFYPTLKPYIDETINECLADVITYINGVVARYNNPNKQRVNTSVAKMVILASEFKTVIQTCLVCNTTKIIPTTLSCGHQICINCVLKIISRYSALICPRCHKKIKHAMVVSQ